MADPKGFYHKVRKLLLQRRVIAVSDSFIELDGGIVIKVSKREQIRVVNEQLWFDSNPVL